MAVKMLCLVVVVSVVHTSTAAPTSTMGLEKTHSAAHRRSLYVSSTYGSDKNDGTTPKTPFKTLSRLSAAGPFDATTVYLARGGIWIDETLNVSGLSDGSISAFGNTSLPRPAIWHSRSAILDPDAVAAETSVCLELSSPTNAVVADIHFAGCYIGVALVFSSGINSENVSIHGCSFADIRTPYGAVQPSFGRWGKAVLVTTGSVADGMAMSRKWGIRGRGGPNATVPAVSGLTLSHNIGIRIDTFFDTASSSVNGLVLDSNTVARCGGNCVAMTAADMHLRSSVFLRDTPEDLFLYGTTDVIIGTVSGDNSIEDNDFNTRGEYEAGPDGCAVDFETSASGFLVRGNTFYRSWGAGIMVFGHATTSHGLNFSDNSFIYAGCVQPRGDRAGIALMCPNGNKPSGTVSNNRFLTCPSSPSIFANPHVKGCADDVELSDNHIDGGQMIVDQPQLSFNPPAPDSVNPSPVIPVIAFCTTLNATLRYTVDGSRPEETSPIFPASGIPMTWPGPNIAVNVRAFKEGLIPSITNGVIIERRRYLPRVSSVVGAFDTLDEGKVADDRILASGWALDRALSGDGIPPVHITLKANGVQLASTIANISRPDLVKAKAAPNPQHGWSVPLDSAVVAKIEGKVTVDVFVTDSKTPSPGEMLSIADPKCLCDGRPCEC